ncbi:MAG: hypothetical protein K2Q06_09865, partial [Parvularculaceae bacterium]|nr:hypothetical protein [Parvularculaceae bacterium]
MRIRLLMTTMGGALAAFSGLALAQGGASSTKVEQVVTPPKQQYWMDVRTTSGLGGMAGGGVAAAAQAMRGGENSLATMQLWLGSADAPAKGDPQASHLVPAAAKIGPNLPLVTPKKGKVPVVEGEEPMEQPKGRLLLFYGCGEKAKTGQPIVFDFSKIAAGETPPGLQSRVRGARSQSFKPSNWRTYGLWPNEKERQSILPAGASLAGDHKVSGNYTPDMAFALGGDKDVMAPVTFTRNEKTATGSVALAWNAVPNATGYHAIAMGGGEDEYVFWSSSAVQTFDGGAYDFVAPREAERLVREKVFLAPSATTCTVPQEVVKAMEAAAGSRKGDDGDIGGMLMFSAYGPEYNKIEPPRPQDPKVAWNQQYAVKARFASGSIQMLGRAMPTMG